MFIFKREVNFNTDEPDRFVLVKRVIVRERPEFNKISMEYHFKVSKSEKDPNTIIFAKREEIMELNWETEKVEVVAKLEIPLSR